MKTCILELPLRKNKGLTQSEYINPMDNRKPELVSPAGDWCTLYTAVESGADSIYFGIKGLNMRNLARNFDISEMKNLMEFLHYRGKKGNCALNVIVFDKELVKF